SPRMSAAAPSAQLAAAAGAILVAARATRGGVRPPRFSGESASTAAGVTRPAGAAPTTGHQHPVTQGRAADADVRGAAPTAARHAEGKFPGWAPPPPPPPPVEAARRRRGDPPFEVLEGTGCSRPAHEEMDGGAGRDRERGDGPTPQPDTR